MSTFSFSDIVKYTNDVVIVTSADSTESGDVEIVYVNEAFEKLTGYLKEEVIGCSPSILQGEGTSAEARKDIKIALIAHQPIRVEILNYAKDGTEYWLDMQIFPLKNDDGKITHFAAIERDITERLKNEEKILTSEARFKSIISSMSDGIVVQDKTGFIESCNDAAEKILGLTKDQMMGRTSIDPRWMAIHEDGSPFPGDEHPAMVTLATGEAQNNVIMGVNKPDDSITWISINSRPIINSNSGAVDSVVATFHDITAQTVANELKSEFVSTVSHELRTPLTAIKGSLGLLSGGVLMELPDKAKTVLEVASRNSDRLIDLINDLLDFDKLSAGKMDINFHSVDLIKTVKKTLESNQPYAEKYSVKFVISSDLEKLNVEIDEGRITQVLTNFLSNAAKFSPKNSDVLIEIEKESPDYVRVSIKDNGAGVAKEFQNRIFERFSQADSGNTRNQGGTGLGLAISKALIEQHNGEIGFRQNKPNGSVFYFVIPVNHIET